MKTSRGAQMCAPSKSLVILVLLIFAPFIAKAQIADSSFFPSVRSLNPGVAHQRSQALVSLDGSRTSIDKNHAVTTGGIQGGVQTDVTLQKYTLFGATKGSFVTFELLGDQETGQKTEHINSTTYGVRDVVNNAKSTYIGGIADFKWIGVSYASANYNTAYKFRVGSAPNVSARDIDTTLDYSLLKVGSAFNVAGVTFGVFGMEKKSNEKYVYTYYDPTTGNQGTTETWPANSVARGYGVGLGFTAKSFRIELSTERMSAADLKADDNPLGIINAAPESSRLSVAGEIRLWKLSLGARVRNIVGNFTDLENLISSNLLYNEASAGDSRLETSFNFGYGLSEGLSLSAFFTQSTTETEEESTIFANGYKYPAKTRSTGYGANVSYYF